MKVIGHQTTALHGFGNSATTPVFAGVPHIHVIPDTVAVIDLAQISIVELLEQRPVPVPSGMANMVSARYHRPVFKVIQHG